MRHLHRRRWPTWLISVWVSVVVLWLCAGVVWLRVLLWGR